MDQIIALAETPAMPKGPRKPKRIDWSKCNQLPNFIGWWRYHRGLTVPQLAEAAGLSNGGLSQIENGIHGIDGTTLYAIARALKCSPGALLLTDDPKNWEAFWPLWQKLEPEERANTIEGMRLLLKRGGEIAPEEEPPIRPQPPGRKH